MHLVFDCVIGGFCIKLEQKNNKNFRLTYGEQIFENLNYTSATETLGECILHAKACEGLID